MSLVGRRKAFRAVLRSQGRSDFYRPQTPVFGQPTDPTCAFVDSGTCKGSGERDFGQLRRLADVATRDVISRTRGRRKLPRSGLELSRFAADAFACCGADGGGDLS